ncbi:hNH endonuclease [Escherichia coli]|nr:hNH endonuclease [Escherichia coli]EJZ0866970.1 hNH endonuclease [Escherichia coli]
MKQMSLIEMDGFLKGKCIPRDLKVNETNAEYLVRKFSEAEAKCAALAAENAGLKAAFDKPQAYLSWHAIPPTWEDPLPCGEYLDVHDDAGHKNSDGTDCWPVYAKPEIETPATDAFLAEARAHDLNAFIRHHSAELDAHIKNGGEQFDEKSVRIRDIIVSARLFREQIRKEAAQ